MRCARCETDEDAGDHYTFYYGTYAGSEYVDRRHTLHRYRIGGSESVFLCDQCLDQYTNRRALVISAGITLVVLVIALIRLLVGGPAPEGSELETVIGFPLAVVLGPILYVGIRRGWKRGKNRAVVGDGLAIQVRKADMKRRGYTKFFTRDQYGRLA